MGLYTWFFGEKKKPVKEAVHITEVPGGGGGSSGGNLQITPANYKQFQIKWVGSTNPNDTDFQPSEYDLEEIKNACAADSYLAVAVQKYAQLIFKAGYSIVSNNDAAAEYIRQRISLMSWGTQVPFDVTLQQIGDDLVKYSNAFLVKSRVETSFLGGLQAVGVLNQLPVGGYYRIDPTTVEIKRDKNGMVKNYQQEIGDFSKNFKPEDVIHFYIDKDGSAAFGTPRLSAVLEDVKLLRKLEGHALTQTYRHANPIFQMIVGVAKEGMMATDREITEAKSEIEKMNTDGIIVTNERTSFEAIGAKGEALDIEPYLKYFENRVFSALNVSASMMGRGGVKQDAESMEEQIHDTVKYFQRQISTFIETYMFNEMLMEGGFAPILNEDDKVRFKFEEISLETRVKMETHALNMFQGNLIPFEEARFKIGKDNQQVDEGRLYNNMIKVPGDLAVVNAKVSATGGGTANTGTSGPSSTKASGSQKTTASTVQPSNQHGTTTMSVKEQADISYKTKKNIEKYKEDFEEIYKRYRAARNDIVENGETPSIVLPLARDGIIKELKNTIAIEMAKGVQRALRESPVKTNFVKEVPTRLLDEKVERITTRVFKDISKRLKAIGKNGTKTERHAAFDVVEYRIRFLTSQIVSKAYWYGYIKTCQYLKIPEVYVHFGKSEDREEHSELLKTAAFSLDDIPAFHAYCSCKIGMEQEEVT